MLEQGGVLINYNPAWMLLLQVCTYLDGDELVVYLVSVQNFEKLSALLVLEANRLGVSVEAAVVSVDALAGVVRDLPSFS